MLYDVAPDTAFQLTVTFWTPDAADGFLGALGGIGRIRPPPSPPPPHADINKTANTAIAIRTSDRFMTSSFA
jgi:hypothetical protein